MPCLTEGRFGWDSGISLQIDIRFPLLGERARVRDNSRQETNMAQRNTNLARHFRKHPTSAEGKVWQMLRDRQLGGYMFRRQLPLGRYIVDFCCIEALVIVELDGAGHRWNAEADLVRKINLEAMGYTVLRFGSELFVEGPGEMRAVILAACESNWSEAE